MNDKIVKLGESIQQYVQELSQKQHQLYNRWAITSIKKAFETGKSEKGIVKDNKTAIGDAMVKYLGEIDTRFLTMEVNCMYTEVFEYLYNTLKSPKNSDDFIDGSRKLGVLKKMYNKPYKKLSKF